MSSSNRWRLWALLPIVLLVGVVSLFVASGDSLTGLIRDNPPAADTFDIRRVEFHPGEIRIRVTNPQPEDLTIAVGDRGRRDRAVLTRRAADARSAALVDDRRAVRVGAGRADLGRRHLLHGDPDDRGDRGRRRDAVDRRAQRPRLRTDRLPRRRRADRVRIALAPVAAPRRAAVARGFHGAHRRAAHVPRSRSPRRGARPSGRASGRSRRAGPCPPGRRWELPDARPHLRALQRRVVGARRTPRRTRARDAGRHRHRAAQPRRRPRDRLVVRARRARARHLFHHRLHGPQHHRGARNRRPGRGGQPACERREARRADA